VVSERVFDLRLNRVGGCTGDPVLRLLTLINEGLNDFKVIAQKKVLPPEVLQTILRKKGYRIEILGEEEGDAFLIRIYKQ
jgi:hypothetical protein